MQVEGEHRERIERALQQKSESGGASVWFGKVAAETAHWCGTPWAFLLSLLSVGLWAALGPFFHYSDTWQLVINTGTTILTFFIVFLIQNTQNRDAKALHLKLDEVIRSIHPARNEMINIEKLSDAELEEVAKQYEAIRKECEQRRARGTEKTTQVRAA